MRWLVLAIAAVPAAAQAGGFARPTSISAHGVGIGGAFVPIADDPTAWHFNPAGAAFAPASVMLGGELIIAPRSYTPIAADGTRGAEQSPKTPVVPLPSLGVIGKIDDRVSVGGGVWNTYGGQLTYEPTGEPAIDESQEAVLEGVVGVGYRVNDRFSVGATLRMGLGLFKVVATERPVSSELSGIGIGVGGALGAMWRPHPRVTLGGVWRSALVVETAGKGTIELPGEMKPVQVSHTQPWPQSASLGVAFAVAARLTISSQVDWTQWSRWETLEVELPGDEEGNQTLHLDWQDSYAVRLGVEAHLARPLALRAGAYFDGNAVPDRTIERQYLDANKFGGSLGAAVRFGAWRVDVAGDLSGGPARTVPDNSAEVGEFSGLANVAPGEHQGTVLSIELALSRKL